MRDATEVRPHEWWLEKLAVYNIGAAARSLTPLDPDKALVAEIARFIAKREKFISAYIQTSVWATNDDSDESGGKPLDDTYTDGADDFADEAIIRIVQECLEFMDQNQVDIESGTVVFGDDSEGHAGHDFFLTRNRHGAGFWDGDWPEKEGKRLTDAAHAFGESQPYIGDDELLYVA